MEPSPQQHESPGKAAANEQVEPRSMSRFKALAAQLFGLDRDRFKEALAKDEAERREKRGR